MKEPMHGITRPSSDRILAAIVSYNDSDALATTARAVRNQVDSLVILDNGSMASALHAIRQIAVECKAELVQLKQNMGIGFALNLALQRAIVNGYQWLLTLDQDSTVAPGMVHQLLAFALGDERISVAAPILTQRKTKHLDVRPRYLDAAITSGNLVRTKIARTVGGYNEYYFIDSVDFEFCLRLRRNGYKILGVPSAHMAHRLGDILSKRFMGRDFHYCRHSPLRQYYMFRNHLYLCKSYFRVFPLFCIKKSAFLMLFTLLAFVWDPLRVDLCKMAILGCLDFYRDRTGRYD